MSRRDESKRFLREARAVVCLTGEHSVRVFDVGELASGIPYIAMEFLVGTDLDSLCAERGRLSVREAVDSLLQAMKGPPPTPDQASATSMRSRDPEGEPLAPSP